jgi:hypothetical protein
VESIEAVSAGSYVAFFFCDPSPIAIYFSSQNLQ